MRHDCLIVEFKNKKIKKLRSVNFEKYRQIFGQYGGSRRDRAWMAKRNPRSSFREFKKKKRTTFMTLRNI